MGLLLGHLSSLQSSNAVIDLHVFLGIHVVQAEWQWLHI
jgi:hypothetical protein